MMNTEERGRELKLNLQSTLKTRTLSTTSLTKYEAKDETVKSLLKTKEDRLLLSNTARQVMNKLWSLQSVNCKDMARVRKKKSVEKKKEKSDAMGTFAKRRSEKERENRRGWTCVFSSLFFCKMLKDLIAISEWIRKKKDISCQAENHHQRNLYTNTPAAANKAFE